MRTAIRQVLDVLRWPLGVFALAGLPSAVRQGQAAILPLLHADFLPFWVGTALVLLFWFLRWQRARWARFITTIEHESLHALVGMITLIPVRELKVREDGSGHVLFEPPGHWLLYLAPYFIPLLLLIEVGLVKLIGAGPRIEMGLLGALLGLELLGHLRQLHPRQTDFRMAGRVFTVAFLPSAFLLAYAAALTAMTQGGLSSVPDVLWSWSLDTASDLERTGTWLVAQFD